MPLERVLPALQTAPKKSKRITPVLSKELTIHPLSRDALEYGQWAPMDTAGEPHTITSAPSATDPSSEVALDPKREATLDPRIICHPRSAE